MRIEKYTRGKSAQFFRMDHVWATCEATFEATFEVT